MSRHKAVKFLFLGEALPIDFVNTEIVFRRKTLDLLGDEADLRRWLSAAGLPSAASKKDLAQAKALRAALRRMFLRRKIDVRPINAVLAGARGRLRLQRRAGQPVLITDFRGQMSPAFLIARAAAEFLATADLSRIRQCEGKDCVLLFYDTTKSHTRRWCSMAGCGNRAKAAAHYRRVRPTAPSAAPARSRTRS